MHDFSIHQAVLERFTYAAMNAFPGEVFANLMVSVHEEHALLEFGTRATIFRLRAEVYGRDLEETIVEYPATWWDAFKQRWFPGWKFNLTRVVIVYRELYPQFKPEGLGRRVVIPYVSHEKRVGWDSEDER